MVGRLLSLIDREIRGLHEAAYVLAAFTLLSQLLALFRDRTFAHLFGAGTTLDVYFAAFRIPDLVFALLTLFVSSFALVPLISSKTRDEQGRVIGSTLTLFGIIAVGVSAILYFLIPYLVPTIVPGFTSAQVHDTEALVYILLFQPVLLGLSSIAASVVQASRQFMLFALAPILYNVGIIIGAVTLYPSMGIEGLAWGVVLGALLHFLVQVAPLITRGMPLSFSITRESIISTMSLVVIPSLPRAVALMGNQALLIAFAAVASIISVGAVSAMSLAFNLQSVPLTIIGVSYAAALFPALALLASEGKRETFVNELWATARHIAFWLLPATMFIIVLRAHLVRVVLGTGAFSWEDTRLTAAIVALFSLSLVAQALILIFSRAHYALQRSLVPIVLNLGGSLMAGCLAYVLVLYAETHTFFRFWFEALFRISDVTGTSVLMIPVAYSIAMIVVAIVYTYLFYREGMFERGFLGSFGISFSASVIGAAAVYGALNLFGPLLPTNTFLGIFTQGVIGGFVGVFVWALILYLLGSRELSDVATVTYNRLKALVAHVT